MPQMYIPGVGDKIVLTQPWATKFHWEGRNTDAIAKMLGFHLELHQQANPQSREWTKIHAPAWHELYFGEWRGEGREPRWGEPGYEAWWKLHREKSNAVQGRPIVIPVTIPDGTLLTIDRIYIKKGLADYNSVTFWALLPGEKKKIRFWCKLDDVNNGLIFRPATPEEAAEKKARR